MTVLMQRPSADALAAGVDKDLSKAFNISPETVGEYRRVFAIIDVDGSGALSAEELQEAYRKVGKQLSMRAATRLVEAADEDGNGEIDYVEFVAMLVETERGGGGGSMMGCIESLLPFIFARPRKNKIAAMVDQLGGEPAIQEPGGEEA